MPTGALDAAARRVPTVLLIEDDASLREVTELVLTSGSLKVVSEGDGAVALDRFRREPNFDLVVLDLMLPSVSGFDICREIRCRSQVPILMLTARTDTADLVAGLELGPDDYVTKPFKPAELLARVRALLRRATGDDESSEMLEVAGLRIDPVAHRVHKEGRELSLSATEFKLLLGLARRPERVFTRDMLLERVWGYDYLGDSRLVDMAVKRLRDKVEDDPHHPSLITTVRGVGYRFDRG
jgi:two-component system response regulator MtrA